MERCSGPSGRCEGIETPDELLAFAESLGPAIMEMGASQEDLDIMKNYLVKNLDNIKGPEDFLMGLYNALMMIGYGYPQLMDPTPADGFMMML